MARKRVPMVYVVSEETMFGDTPLEKRLNAYITRSYIGSKDLPADECQSEAKDVISYFTSVTNHDRFVDFIELLYSHTFWSGEPRPVDREAAIGTLAILLSKENAFQ